LTVFDDSPFLFAINPKGTAMSPDFMLLYVNDPAASARFYGDLLGKQPLDASPGFVMFGLGNGMRLGLWGKDTVAPSPNQPGGFEIGWPVESDAEVDRLSQEWSERGVTIAKQPETMSFGRTFTALDPDGHRLRVYKPALRQ
jgi:catechol 2,3-dioxygenase-like lactoylglutathione lyase family enzyme